MVVFKNVPDAKGFAQDEAIKKAEELSEKYLNFSCKERHCNHTFSVIEITMTKKNGFVFAYPYTCCRKFERRLILEVMLHEFPYKFSL